MVQLLLLLAVVACAWMCQPLASGTVAHSTNDAELHELAGAARRRSFPYDHADRQRLSLRHLESMWHTSLGKELDCASSGREEAFLATLDAEWARLATQADDASKLRSPFLVCTDRHPDVIRKLGVSTHRARAQLVYSRGDTACLVAGIRLDDLDAVRAAEGIHAIEPLPQPAKLSRNLHATLDLLDRRGESPLEGIRLSDSQARHAGKAAEQNHSDPRHPSAPEIRFNHGEGLPSDLEILLTPGAWKPGLVRTWMKHLTSFVATGRLWDEYLRERFLWTRSTPESFVANGASRREGGVKASDEIGDEANVYKSGLIAAHGLGETASLWEQAAARSSEDGACDLGRLRAFPENGRGDSAERGRQGHPGVGVGRSGRKKPVPRDGGMRDRLVLRGAGLLGKTAGDNTHCLLTVLAYLATLPEVAYVDDLPQVIPFNIEAAWITQSGQETMYPMWDHGIDGRTEIIAVADSGLDMNSCFFKEDNGGTNIECSTYGSPVYDLNKRKVVQYIGYVDCEDVGNGHGTHVSGSAAGALSETSPGEHFGDGTGFRSKLALFDFGNANGNLVTPTNLQAQMLEPPYDVGARVSSNSWGAIRTTYTSLDRQMDSFAFMRPDMVLVVAAGNCGDVISGCQYQGVDINGAGSILSPALAKNVIAVGASEASPSAAGLADNVDEVAYFSSQGPTVDDGRIKPDVVAPGYHLFSALANPEEDESCKIGAMAGTSMATPIVAGSAAMVRQYFVQGWYPTGQPTPSDMFNPSNALVKAMLVASGTAMASYDGSSGTTTLSSPPDGIQGFGRILLNSVLNLRGSVDLYVEDAIDMSHGEEHSYTVEMGSSSASSMDGNMKVAMVWIEPAAAIASVSPVFNDLDLLVVGYEGTSETTFYPNNLAAKDPDNTVEVVSISGANSFDSFQVTVTGATVTTDNLPYYALVVIGGVASNYSPTSSTGRSWFVRWEMDLEGIPVTQAATVAFEAGLAEAISSETGKYTFENSTVLVKIDRSEKTTGDDVDRSSSVSVEISVASEADGYAVVTYVNAVAEGSSASADEGLAAALNSALESRTAEDCRCVAIDNGAYDCSACEEGEAFSTVESIATAQGGYNLFSVEGSGQSPVSVLGLGVTENRDDGVWGDFAGGREIRGVLRTDSYLHIAAVVLAIATSTSICGCMLRRCSKFADPVSPGSNVSNFDSHEFDEIFGGCSKPGTPPRFASPTAGRKRDRCWGSPQPGSVDCSSPRRGPPTPIATPAPVRRTPGNHFD